MKIRTLLESLDVAFSMYSAIPMPQIEWNERNMKYMMAFFPMVGVVQGALLLGFSLLAQALGLGFVLFAAVAALLPLFVTGGIHLDGFCDTVDALSSHQTREKKLEILKDPHTGAFAVMGCVAYLLLTFALWTQPQGSGRWLTVQMMAVGFVLSRSMSALSVVSFPCAKSSGLVHSFSSAAQKRNVRHRRCRFCSCLRPAVALDSSAAGRCADRLLSAQLLVLLPDVTKAVWRHHRRPCRDTFCS